MTPGLAIFKDFPPPISPYFLGFSFSLLNGVPPDPRWQTPPTTARLDPELHMARASGPKLLAQENVFLLFLSLKTPAPEPVHLQ